MHLIQPRKPGSLYLRGGTKTLACEVIGMLSLSMSLFSPNTYFDLFRPSTHFHRLRYLRLLHIYIGILPVYRKHHVAGDLIVRSSVSELQITNLRYATHNNVHVVVHFPMDLPQNVVIQLE